MTRHHLPQLVAAGAVLLAVLAGCSPTHSSGPLGPPVIAALTPASAAAPIVPLRDADPTAGLTVAAPDGTPGYARAKFGVDPWPPGPDGCNVRDEVLARQLTQVTRRGRCDITAGTLADPYSGTTVVGKASRDDIDHRYPLAAAWQHGAASWSPAQRLAFATDPLELQTTTAHLNTQKGDKTPGQWLPPANRCAYVEAYVAVARKYHLTITAADRTAILRTEASC